MRYRFLTLFFSATLAIFGSVSPVFAAQSPKGARAHETAETSEITQPSEATLAEIDTYLAQFAENTHLPSLAFTCFTCNTTFLPNATDGSRITIRQLLNHTSGLNTHQTLANYRITEPQGVHHYANVNYSLLGQIIEKISGQSYAEFITENIFTPLGLSETSASPTQSQTNLPAPGHTNYFGFNLSHFN